MYKLIRDDFSGTYLELIKPPYGAPIDRATIMATNRFFEELLKLLHPFMPFITEELWQAIAERQEGESIMVSQVRELQSFDDKVIAQMERDRSIITQIRNLRAKKNLSPKEELELHTEANLSNVSKAVITKLANITSYQHQQPREDAEMVTFQIETSLFGIPVAGLVDVAAEIGKLKADQEHLQKFLKGVQSKLNNPKFVDKAPEAVVAMERKKEQDAITKLQTIQTRLDSLE